MKSLAIMHGGKVEKTQTVRRSQNFRPLENGSIPTDENIPTDAKIYDDSGELIETADFNLKLKKGELYIAVWDETVQNGGADTIVISAESFPGTYRVTGTTYARSYLTGKDEFFQFQLPMAKMSSDKTITMQAEGKLRGIALQNKNPINCWEILYGQSAA